ncbi:MAG: glycosyltransferase family 2 protein [Lentisphaerae bacterium]|nr:glycosyltransferase family 2 protein [Lentisphaerota bacterium]
MRERISACVIVFNEEHKLRRCLASIRWCDEIVVLDSFSTDRTLEVAREFTDRVYQQQWLGYVGQRNTVRELATHRWLLFMDADEEVSPALRDEILEEFSRGTGANMGYEFPRQVYYLGKWIRHGEWYPDVKLRLFNKEFGRTEGVEPHDRVVVHGPVKRLRNPIWHYTYDDVVDHLNRLNRYSTITAQQRYAEGGRLRWADLILHPFFRFIKGYVIRRGFLDGTHGLAIASIASFGAFLKYIKLWELEQTRKEGYQELPDARDLPEDGFQ